MYGTDFWTLWEKAWVGCIKRTTSKHVYYLWWNRSPAQVGCMRQGLRAGALGRPRGIGWRGRWEGGSGWGNTCNSMADSCQCMIKPTAMLWSNWPPTNKNKWKKTHKSEKMTQGNALSLVLLIREFLLTSMYSSSRFYFFETLAF